MVVKSFGPDASVSPAATASTQSIVHWGVQEGRRIAIGGIEPLKLLAVTVAAAPPVVCPVCLVILAFRRTTRSAPAISANHLMSGQDHGRCLGCARKESAIYLFFHVYQVATSGDGFP